LRAQPVVVEYEVLERGVRGEEGNEGRDRVETEGVVGEGEGVEVGQLEAGFEEGVEGGGDLGEEARGEDVGEVGFLGKRGLLG